MANRVAPARTDADSPADNCRSAVCSDWRAVSRFHVGTGHREPTYDAGYTTACASFLPRLSISFLAFWGSPYTRLALCLPIVMTVSTFLAVVGYFEANAIGVSEERGPVIGRVLRIQLCFRCFDTSSTKLIGNGDNIGD